MALMSLRSYSQVKASVVLMRADHLFIHNYIRSLLNIILRPILMVWKGTVIIYNYITTTTSTKIPMFSVNIYIYIYIYSMA